ncbi:MAG: carbon-nitrogen hydrolase family protein [Pseudomonadota bacterium]
MKAAVIQLNSGADVRANLEQAQALLEQAAAAGAVLAALPENCAFMGAKERDKLLHAEPDGSGPIQQFFADIAARLNLWVLAGTLPIAAADPLPNPSPQGGGAFSLPPPCGEGVNAAGVSHVYAASCLYDATGARAARYDKIHLFDVDVPGASGERYRESNSITPGPVRAAVADSPCGKIGLSVCYDLRFPELYRAHAAGGATLLSVPAAFTAKTGAAHWHTLLKARAVENQCYVLAPGQCGTHPGGRSTYGHSLIVGPWGEVLAEVADDAPGLAMAEIDLDHLQAVRASFPVLNHRRL